MSTPARLKEFGAAMPPLFAVGVFSATVGYSLSTFLTILRERFGGFVSPMVGIHPLAAGVYTGSFMALVSNIRYNLLQHVIEPFIESRAGGWGMRVGIFLVRALNGFLGSYLAIMGMRVVGLQRFK